MNRKVNLIQDKSPYFFLCRFLMSFALLYYFFPFYRGVIAPGGKFLFEFLADNFNLVYQFTRILPARLKWVLEVAGYQIMQKDYQSIRIESSRGIIVNPSCLGWAVMSFWTAFVFANKGNVKHKLRWILIGLFSITLLNIIRIALIAVAGHLSWAFYNFLRSP